MKTFKFLDMVRQARLAKQFLVGSGAATGRNFPLCLTCGREVEAAELKNANRTSVEVWVRCHGKEDYCQITFPWPIDGDLLKDERVNWAIKRAMQDYCPFEPGHTFDARVK